MDTSFLLSELGTISEAPGGIDQIERIILKLAVSGRLHLPSHDGESAQDLLTRIRTEREDLVEAGVLSKYRPHEPTSEPYELPESWLWASVDSFTHLEMGQSPPSEYYNEAGEGIPFFQGKADFGDIYPTARYWCTRPSKLATAGDVLISVRAPVGPTNLANEDCCIGRGLARLRPVGGTPSRYLLIAFRAFEDELASLSTGTTFPAISKKKLGPFPLPVPPLTDQKEIVAYVDQLFQLTDELDVSLKARAAIAERLAESVAHHLLV